MTAINKFSGAIISTVSDDPVMVPPQAYISDAYARAEGEKLWSKVWQIACREEDLPDVGDFYTYDILNESIIVVRSAPDTIVAYHNVCSHRGRRLTTGCGHKPRFFCRYHGWRWNLDGSNEFVPDKDDWQGALSDEHLHLKTVKIGFWAGYVYINLDPDCAPLEEFLGTLPQWLDPFEIGKMRYKWRQWLYFPCNWKVAIEAFIESYHVRATHPQLSRFGDSGSWSRAEGRHSCMGVAPQQQGAQSQGGEHGTVGMYGKAGQDPRKMIAEYVSHLNQTVGLGACTTETIVTAAQKLVHVLPESATGDEAAAKMMELACQADAERGVIWPQVDPQHFAQSGIDWHVFPNSIILHGITFILGYRARPHGEDPDSCIFEVYVLERFPEGQEPKPENIYQPDMTEEKWQIVLCQDFMNMPEVQRGMKSSAFKGSVPSPLQEKSVINFHKNLAEYMGTGAPQPFSSTD